jgi:hypothetical protein
MEIITCNYDNVNNTKSKFDNYKHSNLTKLNTFACLSSDALNIQTHHC